MLPHIKHNSTFHRHGKKYHHIDTVKDGDTFLLIVKWYSKTRQRWMREVMEIAMFNYEIQLGAITLP